MGAKITVKKLFPLSWLISFLTLSLFFYSKRTVIESHQLNQALHFGYDAFGRDCILLTVVAAAESMK